MNKKLAAGVFSAAGLRKPYSMQATEEDFGQSLVKPPTTGFGCVINMGVLETDLPNTDY